MLEIEHILATANGEPTTRKIYGSPVVCATVIKACKKKFLILKQKKKFRFSTRERTIGTNILSGKTKRFTAKPLAAEQPFQP